jgi:hypothetical protein
MERLCGTGYTRPTFLAVCNGPPLAGTRVGCDNQSHKNSSREVSMRRVQAGVALTLLLAVGCGQQPPSAMTCVTEVKWATETLAKAVLQK